MNNNQTNKQGKNTGKPNKDTNKSKKSQYRKSSLKNSRNTSPNSLKYPPSNREFLDNFITLNSPQTSPDNAEIVIRVYLYGEIDSELNTLVTDCLQRIFGAENVSLAEMPLSNTYAEFLRFDVFEQTPNIGIPSGKPMTHAYIIKNQYATATYSKLQPWDTRTHDMILTQLEWLIGNEIIKTTMQKITLFRQPAKFLGATMPNMVLIGLETNPHR